MADCRTHVNRSVGEQRTDNGMHDQRCRQQMQPEGNIGALRHPVAVRHVKFHGGEEDGDAKRCEYRHGIIDNEVSAYRGNQGNRDGHKASGKGRDRDRHMKPEPMQR